MYYVFREVDGSLFSSPTVDVVHPAAEAENLLVSACTHMPSRTTAIPVGVNPIHEVTARCFDSRHPGLFVAIVLL